MSPTVGTRSSKETLSSNLSCLKLIVKKPSISCINSYRKDIKSANYTHHNNVMVQCHKMCHEKECTWEEGFKSAVHCLIFHHEKVMSPSLLPLQPYLLLVRSIATLCGAPLLVRTRKSVRCFSSEVQNEY